MPISTTPGLRRFRRGQYERDELVEGLRSALDEFGRRQQAHPKAPVDLSGGFDSTLAAIAARTHGVELIGVSIEFPYYEFRFEDGLQEAVAQSVGITRVSMDGTTHFSFAPSDWSPRLDEPAISVIGLKHAVAPVENRPGGAAAVLRQVAGAGVNVDFLYLTVDGRLVLGGVGAAGIVNALG